MQSITDSNRLDDLAVLHDYICRIPLTSAETRYSIPIQTLFLNAKADVEKPTSERHVDRGAFILDVATAINLGTLCLYLQGQALTALRVTTAHAERIRARADAYTQITLVQPQINIVRLLRGLGRYEEARRGIEKVSKLADAIMKNGTEPPQLRASGIRGGGDLRQVVEHVYWGENIKCLWGEGKYDKCAAMAKAGPAQLVVKEYLLRSLLAMGHYDQVIEWCYSNVGDDPWATVYAALALIRGKAMNEAELVAERLVSQGADLLLRLAVELALAGRWEGAQRYCRLAVRKARDSDNEVTVMLGAALLCVLESDAKLTDKGKVRPVLQHEEVFYDSLHNPARLVCFTGLIGTLGEYAERLARELSEVVDGELLHHSKAQTRLDKLPEVAASYHDMGIDKGQGKDLRRSAAAAASCIESWCTKALDYYM